MTNKLPQCPDLGSDGLSGWPGSHGSWAGIYVDVLIDGGGIYLPGDVIDDRWSDDRPPRVFIPHGPVGQ